MVWYLIILAVAATGCSIPGELEGVVKYADCRATIELEPDDLHAITKQFTCNTQRTASGRIMAATCVHVQTTAQGACERALIYRKTASVTCPEQNPWLSYDDRCYANYDTGRVHARPASSK